MTTDLDALEALAKAAHAEWYAKDLSTTLRNYHTSTRPEVVLALIAELRQERERADRAEWAAGIVGDVARESSGGWQDASAALSRAEETIEKVRRADGTTSSWDDFGHRVLAILTEYDKQKGADLG